MPRLQLQLQFPLAICALHLAAALSTSAAAAAGAPWVVFEKQTSIRLVADPSLVVDDNLEKDFAVGDLDKDGWDDLVVVRKFPGTLQGGFPNILFMNEEGVLVDRTAEHATQSDVVGDQGFHAMTNDRDVKLADVDGDGWLDVVTATTMSDGVDDVLGQPRIYRNLGVDGGGNWLGLRFESARIPVLKSASGATANPRFGALAAADLTGDGRPELFFVDHDSGQADGTCLDLNQDGDSTDPGECQIGPLEAAGADHQNKLLVNDGNGFFADSTTTRMTAGQLASMYGNAVFIEDMNGDGLKDVVRVSTLGAGQNVAIIRALDAAGTSWDGPDSILGGSPYAIAPGDLNGDGRMDLAVVDDQLDRVLINTSSGSGDATFVLYSIADSLFEFGNRICVGKSGRLPDLDNDGFPEVVTADVDADFAPFCPSGRRAHVYRNRIATVGLGSLMLDEGLPVIPTPELGSTFDVAAIDIDRDGWLDLVFGRCAGIDVWMNKPEPLLTFSYPEGVPTSVAPGGRDAVPGVDPGRRWRNDRTRHCAAAHFDRWGVVPEPAAGAAGRRALRRDASGAPLRCSD
jgi:hypothetical protein